MSMIAQNKVQVKNGKILKAGQDEEMKEENEVSEGHNSHMLMKQDSLLVPVTNSDFILNQNLMEGEDNDKEMNIEAEKGIGEPNHNDKEQDIYDSIFETVGKKDYDLGSFGEDDPFDSGLKEDMPVGGFDQSMHLSNGICDSKQPMTRNYINPMDDLHSSPHPNKRYFMKMKDTLKLTLRTLIETKKKEKAQQEEIIGRHDNYMQTRAAASAQFN